MDSGKIKMVIKKNAPLIWAGFIFLVITVSQVHKLPVTDEVVYFHGMATLANDNTILPCKGEGRPTEEDLNIYAHMPFYVWISSIFLKVGGVNTVVARFVPILCSILSLIVVWLILEMLTTDRYKKALIITLLAVHPLFVQNSVLLDIDGSVLNLFLLLTLYSYLKGRIMLMTLSLSLSFFSKLTTGFLVIGAIIIYELLNRKKIALIKYPFITVVSLFITFLINLVFANVSGLDWKYPYEKMVSGILVPRLSSQSTLLSKITLVSMNTIELITWFNIILSLFFLYLLYNRVRRYIKKRELEQPDLFVLTGFIVLLFYALVFPPSFGFPKYYQITIASLIIGLVSFDLKKFDIRKTWLGVLAIAVFTAIFLQDRILYQVIYLVKPIQEFVIQQLAVLISFSVGYLLLKKGARNFRYAVVPLLISFFIVVDMFIIFSPSIGYFYGEAGMKDTIEYVKDSTSQADILISPVDIAIPSERRYYAFEGYDNDVRRDIFQEDIERQDYKLLVLRKKFYRYHPSLLLLLREKTTLVVEYGNFEVRKRR